MAHPESAVAVLQRVWPMVEDVGTMYKAPAMEGRYCNMMILPKKDEKK
jgi:translation initiation factor IF-3